MHDENLPAHFSRYHDGVLQLLGHDGLLWAFGHGFSLVSVDGVSWTFEAEGPGEGNVISIDGELELHAPVESMIVTEDGYT